MLLWDANGFWLFYKRLERGTFERLRNPSSTQLEITRGELSMLLDGFQVVKGNKREHFADEVDIVRVTKHGQQC